METHWRWRHRCTCADEARKIKARQRTAERVAASVHHQIALNVENARLQTELSTGSEDESDTAGGGRWQLKWRGGQDQR